jgi:hypothetical protein
MQHLMDSWELVEQRGEWRKESETTMHASSLMIELEQHTEKRFRASIIMCVYGYTVQMVWLQKR